MTTLILVRHAKSDWGTPELDDHERPLNPRGLRDAPAMAERLAATGITIDAILASTALRARTTAGFFGARFELDPELSSELYGSAPKTLLAAAAERGVESVMIVAHDPGMTMLAAGLSDGDIGHMPTCAVATFRWETPEWDVATAIDPDAWSFDAPGR
ncbi:SixA phosphatase family protein [Microbacterium memoriense]|uniref:Histidine phosphatase family protein n=1 Tax=Microbacterium memoriense TaxID=2978350 RepID=A0ABT2P8L9_9MICO|nr:histidine phosphatase family protein [Microbacterium memoriense]MCT9000993.1 histidine phosphatase family protein [Microbacterium memoriense]